MAAMLLGKKDLEDLELTQRQFTSSIVRAQKQMEGWHFGIRKHLFDYDSVINKQRQTVYRKRDEILESEHDEQLRKEFVMRLRDDILANLPGIIQQQVTEAQTLNQPMNAFLDRMKKEFGLALSDEQLTAFDGSGYQGLADELSQIIVSQLETKLSSVDQDQLYRVFKDVYLHHVDTLRIKHLDEMEELRDKVGLVGYAQQDPLVIYKAEAFTKFQNLLYRLKYDVSAYIASLDYSTAQQQAQAPVITPAGINDATLLQMLEQVSKHVKAAPPQHLTPEKIFASNQGAFQSEEGIEVFEVGNDDAGKGTPEVIDTNVKQKVRPNDPCPCGSGKKYKKCCGMK